MKTTETINSLEYRTHIQPLELRAKGRNLSGYGALFDSASVDMGFTEFVDFGAFKNTLTRDLDKEPILLLWGHDTNKPLSSTRGTLVLAEDRRGLHFSATLPKTTWADDAIAAVEARLAGASFGFRTVRDRWEGSVRHLVEVVLHEISLVTTPAYPETLGEQMVRQSRNGRLVDADHQHKLNRLKYHQLRS